jgi:Glycosyl hydrolase family 26
MIFQKVSNGTAPARVAPQAASRPPPVGWRTGLTGRARAAVAAAGAIALSVAVAGAASASTHSDVAPGARSGLPWASGATLSGAGPAAAVAFGAWRGRPLDVVDGWSARSSWSDIVNPTGLYEMWAGSPYTMALGVAMLPEDVSGVSLQACAHGTYNWHWREFGRVIASYGLGDSIIRLGWEFNGNWYVWQATQPAVWAECWRQIVTSARSTAPGLQWDWNVNRGVNSGLADPAQAYPGNAYVDMIGIDSYDWWPPAKTAAGWQSQLNGTQGLNYWLAFAEAHGKRLSVPEWGNVSVGTSVGGDDPQYVRDMRAFFAANAAHIAFEANFQGSSTGGNYGVGTTVPNAAAAYKAGF